MYINSLSIMPDLVYRGDNEEERRDSAVMHSRLLDHIDRLSRTGFPLTKGDNDMFQFMEEMLIEFPEPALPPEPITPEPVRKSPSPPPVEDDATETKPPRSRIRPVN
jgi:hypothetical protein